jgi:DNA-binding NtrC family response regulator
VEELSFDLQVISSSSSSLAEAVTSKKFREDLSGPWRPEHSSPPLRDREEDLPRLARKSCRRDTRGKDEGLFLGGPAGSAGI